MTATNRPDLTIELRLHALDGDHPAPLYATLDGGNTQSEAYLKMNADGVVWLSTCWPHDATSAAVWHRRTLTWSVPSAVHGPTLRAVLEGRQVVDLLEKVHAGHTVIWDGSNFVGRLSREAQTASDDLKAELGAALSDSTVDVWQAWDWISGSSISTLWLPGETLADVAGQLYSQAIADGVYVDLQDLKEALIEKLVSEAESDERLTISTEQRDAVLSNGDDDLLSRLAMLEQARMT